MNSVTYTGPTTATINISTVNATAGSKAVTIINPDGQASSSGPILTVLPGPVVTLDSPKPGLAGQPLNVQGWAIDGGSPTGTGVQVVHVYAIPEAGPAIFLGQATYGIGRDDVAAIYGSRFSGSGFQLTAPMLPAGNYTVVAYALRTMSGAFDSTAAVAITAGGTAPPFGVVDTPANDVIVAGEVAVTGWALDDAAVARVEIMRTPVAGEGSALLFVGNASFVRGARPDVQAAYSSLPNSDTRRLGLHAFEQHVAESRFGDGDHFRVCGRPRRPADAARHTPDHCRQRGVAGALRHHRYARPGRDRLRNDREFRVGADAVAYLDSDRRQHDRRLRRQHLHGPSRRMGFTASISRRSFRAWPTPTAPWAFSQSTPTLLSNGLHTIAWVVRDNAGRSTGIGSRYFRVQNGS